MLNVLIYLLEDHSERAVPSTVAEIQMWEEEATKIYTAVPFIPTPNALLRNLHVPQADSYMQVLGTNQAFIPHADENSTVSTIIIYAKMLH